MPGKIGTGVIDVAFDPAQIAKAGQEQLLPAGKRLAADLASTFVGIKLLGAANDGIDELKQAATAQSNVEAVIRSTGGAAGVSAEHVDELANSQLKLTGTDDEIIKQGAAKLLTFKQVANQVGEGNDVFDRATKLSLDLAQLGFGSVESASVLLGKALNDPVNGLTALQRVGVSLTDSQKEQVKAFVASGDVLSAQKVILQEVESQVGGAAAAYGETLPGKIAIAQQSLENMKGQLVAGAAPALEFTANAVSVVADKFAELPEGAQTAIGSVVLLGGAVGSLVRPISDAAKIYEVWRAGQEAGVAASEAAAAASATNATATEAVSVAEVQAITTTEGLSAAYAELALAEDGVAANSAATVSGLYATEAAGLSAAAAFAAIVAVPAAVTASLSALSGQLGLTDDGFTDFFDTLHQADADFKGFADDTADFDADTLKSKLDQLVTGNQDYSKALADAHITTGDLTAALLDGGEAYDAVAGKIQNSTDVTEADITAFAGLTKGINDNAQSAVNAAVAKGQLAQADVDAREKLFLLKDGTVNYAAVLQDLADKGLISREAVKGLNDEAAQGPDSEHAKALATWLDAVRKNADEAFAASLKLAPADVRAQEGRLAIADANDKVTDAETKLSNLRKLGTPEQIAKAERDLEEARLAQRTAVLNEADALTELASQQQAAATGTGFNAQETEQFTQGALTLLNTQLNGPTHDAIAAYIFNLEILRQKIIAVRTEQEAAANYTPPTPDIGQRPDGTFDPRLVPPTIKPSPGGRLPNFASGGSPTGAFIGAEEGYEVLLHKGVYQGRPGDVVLNHRNAEAFMTSQGGGRGDFVFQPGAIVLQHPDARSALRRLPDELRAAAYLAGV